MTRSTARRTASVFLAVPHQELQMIAQYRWWLPAMQASVVTVPLISLLVWRGAITHGAEPPVTRDYLTTYLVLVSLVTVLTSSWTAKFLAESIRSGRLNSWLVRPCSTHVLPASPRYAPRLPMWPRRTRALRSGADRRWWLSCRSRS
ncbi:hypothetical protein [Saccharothrix carnea]|uniref:hypothetical protein n=1 Tax=Saccharothrix carnea TaxID=1280637 RepID=UPI000D0DBD56|nr:hypothetical protein [Saccharothrix carnea]